MINAGNMQLMLQPSHVLHGSPAAPCSKPHKGHGSCFICDGGLASCEVCGGGEGALPTLCPGTRMSFTTMDRVYAGRLDFRLILGKPTWAVSHGENASLADALGRAWSAVVNPD